MHSMPHWQQMVCLWWLGFWGNPCALLGHFYYLPHTSSLPALHSHLQLIHVSLTSPQLRSPIVPAPPLFHGETHLLIVGWGEE